ncbi:MAG: hypothetical protein DMD73_15055 [Gemmatimonadetes bacterium]|nr:MAG: hypothetical protein DMD73_15055 [Gemmatimonadota bacterium]
MRLGSAQIILRAMGMICVCLLGVVLATGQSPDQAGLEQKPLLAEQAFKNVQLLKGVPIDEFLETMGFFAASTGMNCTECHSEESSGNWAKYADDTPLKQRARMMILMVTNLNRGSFGGKRMVTCWTCHRGTRSPRVIPDLSIQYSDMLEAEPDEILAQTSGGSSVDQILNKYIEALGGTQRVSNLTTFAAKGTYAGYETAFQKFWLDCVTRNVETNAPHRAYGRGSGWRQSRCRAVFPSADQTNTYRLARRLSRDDRQ